MAKKNAILPDTSDREIVMERVFNAPRELVFKVWTDPEHVKKWFGPEGFTNTILEMDVRPGGTWRFIMHGPDGRDFPNKVVFTEVVKPELLTYTHTDDSGSAEGISFEVTVRFEDQGNQTKLVMRSVFQSAEILDYLKKNFYVVEGGIQHLNCLEKYLKSIG